MKLVDDPGSAGVAVKAAVGAWSGVAVIADGEAPRAIAVPGVLAGMAIGVTLLELELATYAVAPLGVMAMP